MAEPQRINPSPLDNADPVWARIRSEAEAVVRQEPQLASFIHSSKKETRKYLLFSIHTIK